MLRGLGFSKAMGSHGKFKPESETDWFFKKLSLREAFSFCGRQYTWI